MCLATRDSLVVAYTVAGIESAVVALLAWLKSSQHLRIIYPVWLI